MVSLRKEWEKSGIGSGTFQALRANSGRRLSRCVDYHVTICDAWSRRTSRTCQEVRRRERMKRLNVARKRRREWRRKGVWQKKQPNESRPKQQPYCRHPHLAKRLRPARAARCRVNRRSIVCLVRLQRHLKGSPQA